MVLKTLSYMLSRFKNPCGYAGIGVVMHSIQYMLASGFSGESALACLSGIIAFILPNTGKGDKI